MLEVGSIRSALLPVVSGMNAPGVASKNERVSSYKTALARSFANSFEILSRDTDLPMLFPG